MFHSMYILIHPHSYHIWRTAPVTLLEQHHRTHSIILDQCAFGAPWKLRTKLIAGHFDYQEILAWAENTCEELHVCAFSRGFALETRPPHSLCGMPRLQHVADECRAHVVLCLGTRLRARDNREHHTEKLRGRGNDLLASNQET